MLAVRLDPDLEDALEREAKRTGRSKSLIVRDAVRRHLAVSLTQTARLQDEVRKIAEHEKLYPDDGIEFFAEDWPDWKA
jgi:predicted transcriptional regulator